MRSLELRLCALQGLAGAGRIFERMDNARVFAGKRIGGRQHSLPVPPRTVAAAPRHSAEFPELAFALFSLVVRKPGG